MTDRRFINQQHLDSGGARLKVECRFCTHKQQYNKFQHVAPCGCIGSTRYVHRSCLQNWFVVKFEHVYNQAYQGDPLDFNVFCEICQQKMEIEFSLTKKCSKYDQILERLEEDKLALVVAILVALASIGVLVFILIFASISYVNPNLLAIIVSLALIIFVADLTCFCWKFLLIKSIDIEYVANHKEPPKLLVLAEEDINNIEQYESYRQDPHFGQALSRNPADKSLMLESNRNSGSQKRSSLQSKTFTDIVMRQMYQHDLPSQRQRSSNTIPMKEDISQRQRETTFKNRSRTQKEIKKSNYQKQYVEQSVQVTAFKQKKESTNETKYRQTQKDGKTNQKEDKSVQMSRQQKSFQRGRSKSRSKRIFEKTDSHQKDPSRREDKNQVKENEQLIQKRFIPQNSEEEFEPRKYNIIKQKSSSSEEQYKSTIKKRQIQRQKQSVSVSKSSNRVKLKNLKDPIKIKIRF